MDQIIEAADGYPLAATFYEAAQPNGRTVLINSAMGVPRRFYRRYAEFLSGEGFHVLTYDYRGIGESQSEQHEETLWLWGAQDQAAMIGWCRAQFPDARLLVVGHSVGGQIIGFTPEHQQIDAVLGIAAQDGYWRNWSGAWRVFMFSLWHVLIPVACRLTGRLPKYLLGGTEDVPSGVALEWAKSGRLPDYVKAYFGERAHFDAVTLPIQLWSFADDRFAPRAAVEALGRLYSNADVVLRHIEPSQKVGHFGFFRDPALWAESLQWLCEA